MNNSVTRVQATHFLFSARDLPRSAALRAICARRSGLRWTLRASRNPRELRELLRPSERGKKETWHAEIGIQLLPVKPAASRTHLDGGELSCARHC